MRNDEEKRKRRRHGHRSVLLMILILLVLIGSTLAAWFVQVEYYDVTGCRYTRKEDVIADVFRTENDKRILKMYLNLLFRTGKNPAYASVDFEFSDMKNVTIVIEETVPVAEIQTGDMYVPVTKDGVVMGVHAESFDLPVLTGIKAEAFTAFQKPEEAQEGVLGDELRILKETQKYELEINHVSYTEEQGYSVQIGNVRILLGEMSYLTEKISQVRDQAPYYQGLTGTLHMENFDGSEKTDKFYFTVGE